MKNKPEKIYHEVKSLEVPDLLKIRDKLIPIFLDIENLEPYKDQKVIKLLKKRKKLANKQYKTGRLIDAEKYLRKQIG